LALGQARTIPLAWLAGYPEFFDRYALTVGNSANNETVLPGWWRQMISSQRRQTRRVLAELIATRGIMPLLMKVRNGGHWTRDEKLELIRHLRRMVRLSPYLIALLLPGSILFLPIYAWWLDRRRFRRDD
jgi:hypothetical protein